MADWVTISALATAGGTLVLAGATFASVRSAHTSTRVTERALLAAIRPLLLGSRLGDQPQKVRFRDDHLTLIEPGRALVEIGDDAIYLAFGVRNAGSGLAVLDRWKYIAGGPEEEPEFDFSGYRRLTRDLFVPAGDVGFWQGAFREPTEADFPRIRDAITTRDALTIDVLYGDHEGGQRVLSRFLLTPLDSGNWLVQVIRHWNVDRPDPR
jgi:hypothetical protein